jgi:hypothetical protein
MQLQVRCHVINLSCDLLKQKKRLRKRNLLKLSNNL